MAISKPMLPPKKGYVEVEVNGVRTYRNVETGILIKDEIPAATLDERVTAIETAISDGLTLYEEDLSNA